VNSGEVVIARLRLAVDAVPLRPWDDGRIRLACDVSNWLRPDAETSPERLFCHTYARGKGNAQLIPGWPYSWVAALEPGRTSWALPPDAVRPGPADDATEVVAAQLRGVIARLIAAGHWKPGDPDIIIVLDAGYDLTRLAWFLDDLPADVTGRLRSDRVMHFPAPPLPARPASTGGRRPRHGRKLSRMRLLMTSVRLLAAIDTHGWTPTVRVFKGEGGILNIGLGRGRALDIFNDAIEGFEVVS